MANFNIEFYSNSLARPVQFKMIIPNDPCETWGEAPKKDYSEMKTIFLLHGYTGAAGNWIPEYLATEHNFAIVIPSGENGFWVDGLSTGHKFGTFLTEELVDYVRRTFGLAKRKEDTFIMGFSMGGFGALRAGLSHPDTFGKIIALSSAMIIHNIANIEPGFQDTHANYYYYYECFGDLSIVEKSQNNPEVLIDGLLADKKKIPDIYMAVGTEDFLLEENRTFHKYLEDRNVSHTYFESVGNHDMVFWDEYARKFVPMLFE